MHFTLKSWSQVSPPPGSNTYQVLAAIKKLWIRDGITQVGSDDVEAKSFWRLISHLDTILQDGSRKLIGGVAG